MESHVQRPTAGSTVTTRPDQKDSWIAVAGRIPVRTQPLSRWRPLFSCSVPSIRLGVRAKLRQGWECYSQNWCGLRLAHSENAGVRNARSNQDRQRLAIRGHWAHGIFETRARLDEAWDCSRTDSSRPTATERVVTSACIARSRRTRRNRLRHLFLHSRAASIIFATSSITSAHMRA
jgi:hypothetical protein